MSNQVFISYCREDKEFALQLIEDLREQGISVWYDANIKGGEAWANKIEDAVDASVVILVILSPDSVESYEVGNEIAYSLAKKKRIIPLMLRKCQTPLRLSSLNRHDFTGDYPPALQRLIADIQDAPMPIVPPKPTVLWYRKPVFYVMLALLFLLLSFLVIYLSDRQNKREQLVNEAERLSKDTIIQDKRDTVLIGDTTKTRVPGAKSGRKFTGTIGEDSIEMTIISQVGATEITGTYFFVTNPSRQISFDGTEIDDEIKIKHLADAQIGIKVIKTSTNTYTGALRNLRNGQIQKVNLSRPRFLAPKDIWLKPGFKNIAR